MLTCSSSLYPAQSLDNSPSMSNGSASLKERPQGKQPKQPPYEAAVQDKFMHLQAEVELLLQQLQSQKQQLLASGNCDSGEEK